MILLMLLKISKRLCPKFLRFRQIFDKSKLLGVRFHPLLLHHWISRLRSVFIFLRCLKLAHVGIQVTTLHMWDKQRSYLQFLIGNPFHGTLRIVSPWIRKECSQVKR